MCSKHQSRVIFASMLALLALTKPAAADDQTLKQSTPAQLTGWEPIISELYILGSTGKTTIVDGAVVPDFDSDTAAVIKPRLDVFAPPPEIPDPPPLYIDWQQFVKSREAASAWWVTKTVRNYEGLPRLGVHRIASNYSDAPDAPWPFVTYDDGATIKLHLRIDVPFEKLPFTAPAGTDRKKSILEKIKVVDKKITFERYSGVRKGGEGGRLDGEDYNATEQLKDLTTLAAFADPDKPFTVDFMLRTQTVPNAAEGTFDAVVVVSCRFELEAGAELGFNPAERKTLEGQLRIAIVNAGQVKFRTLEESRRNR